MTSRQLLYPCPKQFAVLLAAAAVCGLHSFVHCEEGNSLSRKEVSASERAYLLTYSLTPCSTVLLEKLTGSQLIKKFPAIY